jgi:hypothetical protein
MDFGVEEKQFIKSLFHHKNSHVCVYDSEFQTDICFSFWGFPKSDHAYKKLISFLCWCLQPRMYMTGYVSPGRLEAFMIVRLSRLCVTRPQFELWLELLLNVMNMSAGTHFFSSYMDDQMLSCLQRIETDRNRMTNVMSEWNKDFRLLCRVLSKQRYEAKRVSDSTGVELDATNFIKLFYDNQQLLRENKELQKRVASTGEEFPRLHSLVSETQEAGPASSSRVILLRRVAPLPTVLS